MGGAGAVEQLAGRDRCAGRRVASSRCSVETNSSLKRAASSKARSSTWFSGCERYMPGCMPAVFGQIVEHAPGFGDDGVGLRHRIFPAPAARCLPVPRPALSAGAAGTSPGFRRFSATPWDCCKASCAFCVSLSNRNMSIPPMTNAGRRSNCLPFIDYSRCRRPHRRLAPCLLDAVTGVRCLRLTSILIWRGLAASFLGSVTVSTPFLYVGGDLLGIEGVGHREAAR